MNAVVTSGLTRRYVGRRGGTETIALSGVDLEVAEGEVRGLLGPNGAGKTTLCKILSTVLLPSAGTATVLGHDVVARADIVKRTIGIVFGGDRGLYGQLTARENLNFWAALYGLRGAGRRSRVEQLLERMGLAARADERVAEFSRGMKQRLHLARGLVADPPVLILDEPTVGMDPVAAHDFRALIGELRADRRTVLLTTHDMAEAEAVCDRVTLVDHGRILMTARPDEVGPIVSGYERIDAEPVDAVLRKRVEAVAGVASVSGQSDVAVRIETRDSDATRQVLEVLVGAGVTAIAVGRPGLEEVYLHLVGERGMEIGR